MTKSRAISAAPRALCAALLAVALLLLAACSYSTDFVVVNDSGSPVEVSYSFKDWREPGDCCPSRPAKMPLDKLDDSDGKWNELRAEDFHFDPGVGVVRVTLAPAEALRVSRLYNWSGHGASNNDRNFQISSLRITGASGSVYYEGTQAQYQFQAQDANLYKLTYYGWGEKR